MNTWGGTRIVQVQPNLLAIGAGPAGLIISDIRDPQKPVLLTRRNLETLANQLALAGTKLYVLGDLLTVVDLTNPLAPGSLAGKSLSTLAGCPFGPLRG